MTKFFYHFYFELCLLSVFYHTELPFIQHSKSRIYLNAIYFCKQFETCLLSRGRFQEKKTPLLSYIAYHIQIYEEVSYKGGFPNRSITIAGCPHRILRLTTSRWLSFF